MEGPREGGLGLISGWPSATSESVITTMAGFGGPESVVTSATGLAGFADNRRPRGGPQRDPGLFQIYRDGLPANPGFPFNPPQRPSQPP